MSRGRGRGDRRLWRRELGTIVTAALLTGALGAAEIPDPDFLRTYAETYRLSLGHPTSIRVADDGSKVFFLRSGARSQVRDLFAFDAASGEERLLADAETLLGGEREELTPEEKARRERQRLAARGIARYQPFDGGERLLVPLAGKLIVLDVESGATQTFEPAAGTPIDPRPSPSNRHLGYVVDQDFYLLDLTTGDETRLTHHESDTVTYGLAEFVAQEEMDRDEGYWFSPDGTHVVVERQDTAPVETMYMADSLDPFQAPHASAYPRPGEDNAEVTLHILPVPDSSPDAATDRMVAVEWDRARYPYLATVAWQEGGPLTIVVQNRLQTELRVLAVDARTGATQTLLVERDEAWLELDQDVPRWLADGSGFLWTSERNGTKQLELRAPDGSLVRVLTEPTFGYRGLVEVDETRGELLVTASDDPTTTYVWRLPLAGGPAHRLTDEPGQHDVEAAADGSLYALTSSLADGPRRVTIVDRQRGVLGTLTSQAVALDYTPTTEWVTVGDRDIRATITRPRDFDAARRYPVIVHVYAGPTSLMVRRTRDRYYLAQWFADNGFIVVSIDGRGTPNRGRDWQRAVKHDLVTLPMEDQAATLRALGERFPELDTERAGIFGWSFGGYAAAMAVMRQGDVWKAGVAGAPVIDWQDYDTHYTERYLGLPQETPEAYAVSNVLTYAEQLERPLMIVHGTADDNVLFLHSLKVSDALFRAGKPHEFIPLPGHTHMLIEPAMVENLYGRVITFFRRHLGTPAPKADAPKGP